MASAGIGRSGRRVQYAALPYRIRRDGTVEVRLITSRETRRWVIPKGWPMKGVTPAKAAARETFEEAGLLGTVSRKPLGLYTYDKRLANRTVPCDVMVFPLKVKRQLRNWPERSQRFGFWFSIESAAAAVLEEELKELIFAFGEIMAQKLEAKRAQAKASRASAAADAAGMPADDVTDEASARRGGADKAQAEKAKSEKAKLQKAKPAKAKAAESKPGKTDAAKPAAPDARTAAAEEADGAKGKAKKAAPPKAAPKKAAPKAADVSGIISEKADISAPVPKKAEPKKAELRKAEVKKAELKKAEPKKAEPKKAEPKKPEAKKPEVKKPESKKAPARKQAAKRISEAAEADGQLSTAAQDGREAPDKGASGKGRAAKSPAGKTAKTPRDGGPGKAPRA